MQKRLYRSRTEKMVGGVCGGLGEYFEVDPVLVRLLMVLLILTPGISILLYIVAWIIIPMRPYGAEAPTVDYSRSSLTHYIPGLAVMLVGIVILIHNNWFWFDWDELWPAALILAGVVLILRKGSKRKQERQDAAQDPDVGSDSQGSTS